MPRGPAGITEISRPTQPHNRRINSRTLVAPAAAFTMACILFVYTRTSIRAAKANAQRHRDADGGNGLDLLNESRRRHGSREQVDDGSKVGAFGELAGEVREQFLGRRKEGDELKKGEVRGKVDEAENKLKAAMGKRRNESD